MARTTLSVADFGAFPNGQDCTANLVRAAQACRGRRGVTLQVPEGCYRISPSRGSESWGAISNHDQVGPRRVALHLVDCEDFELQGTSAQFLATGHVVPIWIHGGADVRLQGLTIDWQTALHGWGEVVGGWNGWIDVKLTGGHPWKVVKERLAYLVDGALEEIWSTYAMDPRGLVPALKSGDNCGSAFTIPYVAEALDGALVRLRTHVVVPPPPGHVVILRHGLRVAPAICASEVNGVELTDITIHHAGGMGVIMQRCRNPQLERVQVIASEGRPLSANHDATHFVACAGTVRLHACRFERQLDDATNIHGIYQPIVERVDERRLGVRLVHVQQRGNVVALPGERMAVIDRATMMPLEVITVAEVHAINAEFCELTFTQALPECAQVGEVLENLDWKPDIDIRSCQVAHNRARGLLIASGEQVTISDNRFESPGPAIVIHGDARSWYEAGAVGSVHIHHNVFHRCGYAQEPRWGSGVIQAAPEMERVVGAYHQHLLIEDNRFEHCLLPLLDARGVGTVEVRRNLIQGGSPEITHRDCGQVSLEQAT